MPRHDYYLPQRQLVSQNDAAVIQSARVPRSRFMNTWTRKMTFDAGFLVPFLCNEVLPGDHLSYDVTAYIRMSTPLFPIFDSQRIDTFFFFVPNRILWDNWEKFMGAQDNPGDSIAFTIPALSGQAGGWAQNSIYDHMGLPVQGQISPGLTLNNVSALPFRAYNKIWNEWFRDQNIQNAVTIIKGSGPDATATYNLLKRGKAHDYFTSCLPWTQKFTAPTVPLGTTAPVIGIGIKDVGATITGPWTVHETDVVGTTNYPQGFETTAANVVVRNNGITVDPKVYADLSQSTGIAINTLRQAWMIQSLLERDARGGTRYTEKIRAHFDVINPDFRLQRPEYIGGGQSPITITPVAQTTPVSGGTPTPVGSLGAAGTAAGTHRASYAATEHGYIIGLINVRTELSYQQGLPRHFSRRTQYEFYFPEFAGLGEQAVLRKEIYATGDPTADEMVFGYQERWHEYRTQYSEITGRFRSTSGAPIDQWHLGQRFVSAPTLSPTFIEDTPPMDRVLAAGATAAGMQYLADIQIRRSAVRPVPTYGTPASLGRF